MPDGEFFAAVAEEAECGILLDLHNLYCNEKNGRSRLRDVLGAMPMDRVWEVHLAGGQEQGRFYLDGHPIDAGDVFETVGSLGVEVAEILPDDMK